MPIKITAIRARVAGAHLDPHTVEGLIPGPIRRPRMEGEGRTVAHRAMANAEAERQVWLAVGRFAQAERALGERARPPS